MAGVTRSSVCEWRWQVSTVTADAARRADLAVLIADVFDEYRATYGYRRIAR